MTTFAAVLPFDKVDDIAAYFGTMSAEGYTAPGDKPYPGVLVIPRFIYERHGHDAPEVTLGFAFGQHENVDIGPYPRGYVIPPGASLVDHVGVVMEQA